MDILDKTDFLKSQIKSELTFKRLFNFLLIFVAVMLLGLMNFATFTFELERIKDISLWTETAVKVLAISAIYLSVSSEKTEKLIISDIAFLKKKDASEKLAAVSRPDICNEYLVIYNRKIKSEKFRELININLSKLERKSSQKKNLEWQMYVKFQADKDDTKLEPSWSKFVKTKSYLIERQSDAWIEKHIDEVWLKYDETFYSELTSGVKSGGYGHSPLKKSGTGRKMNHVVITIIKSFALMILFNSIVPNFTQAEIILDPILDLCMTLFLVLWNVIGATHDGKLQFEFIEVPKVDFVQSILKQYVKYEQDNYNYNIWFDEKGNICSDSAKLREKNK